MEKKPTLTNQDYEEASQRLNILADAIAGIKETQDMKEVPDLKILSQEVIQYLRRML